MRSTGFYIRQKLQWRGRTHKEGVETAAPQWEPTTDRGRQLLKKYPLHEQHSELTLRESLGHLDLLDRFQTPIPDFSHAVEVGVKNWRYLPGLAAWLKKSFKAAKNPRKLIGVEVDAYRLDRRGCSYFETGSYFADQQTSVDLRFEYQALDFKKFHQPVDLLFWFFPLVCSSTHKSWGLPKELFRPRDLFHHAADLLKPQSGFIVVNQGDWEWEESWHYLKSSFDLKEQHVVKGSLHPSDHPIVSTLLIRK
ncbi:hypothetical protein K2X30_03675 [bacterium]|jgi:hypothetical protein|nr:hypothetical protein [bacterium]